MYVCSMYVCMYLCMYACMYVCVYVRMYVCTKLINALSKSAKLEWGLKYRALRTIYTGAILPLLSYAAPVWSKAMTKVFNQKRITRVQRLMNIRISKAFRTTSEALCVVTGLAPITIEL